MSEYKEAPWPWGMGDGDPEPVDPGARTGRRQPGHPGPVGAPGPALRYYGDSGAEDLPMPQA